MAARRRARFRISTLSPRARRNRSSMLTTNSLTSVSCAFSVCLREKASSRRTSCAPLFGRGDRAAGQRMGTALGRDFLGQQIEIAEDGAQQIVEVVGDSHRSAGRPPPFSGHVAAGPRSISRSVMSMVVPEMIGLFGPKSAIGSPWVWTIRTVPSARTSPAAISIGPGIFRDGLDQRRDGRPIFGMHLVEPGLGLHAGHVGRDVVDPIAFLRPPAFAVAEVPLPAPELGDALRFSASRCSILTRSGHVHNRTGILPPPPIGSPVSNTVRSCPSGRMMRYW